MELYARRFIKTFTDMMSEGFIVINKEGIIEVYNKKAREIFGLDINIDLSHPEGQIEEGDIVIIADNALGLDDGNLGFKDLELLGLVDEKIEKNDGLLLIGSYKTDYRPKYKIINSTDKYKSYSLEYKEIKAEINYNKKKLKIKVAGTTYALKYKKAIGHMLVLDGKTREVKFFQYYGYTARGECIRDLLRGGSYYSKGKNIGGLRVLGERIDQIHTSDSIIKRLINVSKGLENEEKYLGEEINGIPTICTILRVEDRGKVVGAALKVEDMSEINKANEEKNRVYERLKKTEEKLYLEDRLRESFPNFVGRSKEISQVKRLALKASKNKSNVLILGKSGTGKSVLARAIHNNSDLKSRPFVEINCGAIPENLLESELFGYEAGAFTGASEKGKDGLFKTANGGTIFLDEIGDLPKSLQVKILQTIQDKSFYPVGSTEKLRVDVRIITASNKNLEQEVIDGKFREDLYYRINVFPIYIPELEKRREDIYDLVKLKLPEICERLGEEKGISAEALNKLYNYSWPGNIRELENILERAVSLAEGSIIFSRDIKIGSLSRLELKSFKDQVLSSEKEILKNTINLYNGDKKKAMEALAMSRSNFYKKLSDYNIN